MATRAKTKIEEIESEPLDRNLLKSFGANVRRARKSVKMTQAQLGTCAGLAQSYIFEIETQGANVTLKTMAAIARCLKTSMRDLLPDNEFDAVSPAGVAELCKVLERLMEALKAQKTQQSELVSALGQLDDFVALKDTLKRLGTALH